MNYMALEYNMKDYYLYSSVILASVVVFLVFLYRALLPVPLPGIPYNKASARRLLGDIPDLQKYQKKMPEIQGFLTSRCEELKSPVAQVWLRPFGRPWVIVQDWRQAREIMTHRTKEFDRSPFHIGVLISLVPDSIGTKPTNDQFHWNRRLISGTMSPQFLHDVAIPAAFNHTMKLVQLFLQRAPLQQDVDKGFDISNDLKHCLVDTSLAMMFGDDADSIESQIAQSKGLPPEMYTALTSLAQTPQIAVATPLGRIGHWLALKLIPKYRRELGIVHKLVEEKAKATWHRINVQKASSEYMPTFSGLELLIEREIASAKQEGRQPNPFSLTIRDEIFGLLLAGYETNYTATAWSLKYLTKYQSVQKKLRESLQNTFKEASEARTQPDQTGVAKGTVPYLDAVIDEVLRHSSITVALSRAATTDTQVLGYAIPKGTEVFFPGSMCLQSAQASEKEDTSDMSDMSTFDPERWLVVKPNGHVEFNPMAAPMLSFGIGPRACFGKRLAYMNLRVIIALIIWNFELIAVPSTDNFKAKDFIFHQPQVVEMKLRAIVR